MKPQKIAILVLTLLVVGAAVMLTHRNQPTTEVASLPFYPRLLDRVNDVVKLEIRSKDQTTVLRRKGEAWVVESRDGYPALAPSIKRLLLALANLTIIDAKTDEPEKYAKLGVEGLEKPDSASIQITASDARDAPVVALIIGKKRDSKIKTDSAHFVRKLGEARAYLVKGDLAVSAKPNEWLNTDLFSIPLERVRRVTLNPYQAKPVMLTKAKHSDSFFTLENVPKGFEPRSRTAVSSLGGLLTDIHFETVLGADKNVATVPRVIAEVQTWDGLVATVEELDHPDHVYARFGFAYNPDLVVTEPTAAAAPGADGKQPTAPPAKTDVSAEAAMLNALVKGWIYGLPDYKVRMLEKKMDDLIQPAEKPKAPADAGAPDGGAAAAPPSGEAERMPPTIDTE